MNMDVKNNSKNNISNNGRSNAKCKNSNNDKKNRSNIIIKTDNVIFKYSSIEEIDENKVNENKEKENNVKENKAKENNVKENNMNENILNGISIEVIQGKFIGILGHNGCGKSTFARMLNGLLTPDSGTVYVDGNSTRDLEKITAIRQDCGMVFQNPDNQIIGMTVEEDVGFGPENLGLKVEQIWKRVNDSINTVKLNEFRKRSPNRLSGGQKQRVAIASVLAMKPRCIVLDEPTAMLDPVSRKEVINTIKKLNKEENITIILVTHHMEEVIDADVLYVMNNGNISLSGEPKEVFSKVEELRKIKLDVPIATELSYELMKKGIFNRCDIIDNEEFVEEYLKIAKTTPSWR